MEKLDTKISKSWVIRMVIAGTAFLAFGAMSVYDGKVRYPAVNRDFRAFLADHAGVPADELKTVYGPGQEEALRKTFAGASERWNSDWKQRRKGWWAKRGWKDMDQSKLIVRGRGDMVADIPGPVMLVDMIHSEWDLRTQLLMAAVCLPVGLVILFRLIRNLPKTAWVDESVFHTLDGKAIPFSTITGFDKKKWDRKSIAYVLYDIDGKSGKALLDEWIFTGSAAILERLENAVNPPGETGDGSAAGTETAEYSEEAEQPVE
ncbi:MAG: hypothetical protein RRC34_03400 [Lentisphaeria bacterium]|nr:hypothetical protein [Lentisphaeria bacterium]